MRDSFPTRLLAACILLLAGTLAPRAEAPKQDLRFGLRLRPESWPGLGELLAKAPPDPENPLGVTLVLPAQWGASPDWGALERAAATVRSSGALLHLSAGLPCDPDSEDARAYLLEVSTRAGEEATLGLDLDRERFSSDLLSDPDRLALTLKRLTAALRGSRPGGTVFLGEVTAGDLPFMAGLYERDLRAYVDGYSARAEGPSGDPPQEVVRFLREHHPGAPLWLHLPGVSTGIGAQLLVLASAYRDATFVDMATDRPEEVWGALLALRAQLGPRVGPGFATRETSLEGAGGPREDLGVLHLLDSETFRQFTLVVPVKAGGAAETLTLTVPTEDVSGPEAFPLPGGPSAPLRFQSDSAAHSTRIEVPFGGGAVLVSYERLKTGSVGHESMAVSEVYRIPVEVILARHQAVQLAEDLRLDHYAAKARVDYHFKLPGSTGSVDLTFLNTFLYERGVGARWVQEQLLLNGVAWKGKRIPELPVIEPEKVNVLPLALTLGRDYSYRYLRDEEVEGVPCHLVEFVPASASSGSFYQGRVWIERDTYRKRRMSVRQTGLAEPQVSNEEVDDYADVEAPDGGTFRLLAEVSGQQIFSLMGRNIIAERRIEFTAPDINGEGFRAVVAEAEASDHLILQETESGLRYLDKQPDGSRKLDLEPDTHRAVAVGGIYKDPSLRYPLPMVGVAYLDYAWKGPKNQLSAFVTGVVNTLNVSKVNLWPEVDGRLDAVLILVPLEDKYYVGGEESRGERVKVLREMVSAGLGWRPFEFFKASAGLDLAYHRYSSASGTSSLFTVPTSHGDVALTASAEFSRWGWSLDADASFHRRTDWEPWGLDPAASGAERARDYARWNVTLSKSFYLPAFQKIGGSASWFDGSDLDRFSQYSFTYMGRYKMAGFAGSGVRFSKGGLLHLIYDFNLAEVVRFSVQADAARVRPSEVERAWQDHLGVGLSFSVVGPWRTYWTLDLGRALRSDIHPLRGETTAALLVMKFW